jgi:hypothetical protein
LTIISRPEECKRPLGKISAFSPPWLPRPGAQRLNLTAVFFARISAGSINDPLCDSPAASRPGMRRLSNCRPARINGMTEEPSTRRRFRFSLRALLALMLLIGCGLGWLVHERRQIAQRPWSLEAARFGPLPGYEFSQPAWREWLSVASNLPRSPMADTLGASGRMK